MIIANGTLTPTCPSALRLNAYGEATPTAPQWGTPTPCQWRIITANELAQLATETHPERRYQVLLEARHHDATATRFRLHDLAGRLLFEGQARSVEQLEAVQQVRLTF